MFSFFERLTEAFPNQVPKQPPRTILAFCRYYSAGMWHVLISVSILSAAIAILEVSLFGFMGQLIDWFATRNPGTFVNEEKQTLIWMGLLVLVLLPGLVILESMITHQSVMGNYPMRIRWLAHKYLLKQSLSFYQDEFAGRVATKVMQTALSVRETVTKVMTLAVYMSVYFLSAVLLVFSTDWRLAALLIIWLIAYVIILKIMPPKLKKVSKKQADARSIMNGRIMDRYTNMMTVKLFSHHQREEEYAKEGMDGFLQTVYPQMRLVTVLQGLVWGINSILVFAISALAIDLWVVGSVSPGDIAIAVSLSLRLNGMSQWIMWEVSSLFENIGTVQDGIDTLAIPTQIEDAPHAKNLIVNGGAITLEDVQFAYHGKNATKIEVFDNLNIEILPGEKVGLVGRSGAGKSTLVNLLLRFYDIQSGQIKIDDQSIKELSQESLRANISMVTQDTSLMHRSVRDNIMYGKENATEAQMIAAAKQAQAHDFILNLSDAKGRKGYDAHVGERGVKLSGGQRQRIAIARVMLKDAPILILDEATSALDSEVEVAIQEGLSQIMRNKTVLAIAHRLSTIAQMDRLLVLDNGKIVESGSHKELLDKDGIYAKLWAHQTGGFIGID